MATKIKLKRPNKYRAKRVVLDGIGFHSQGEATRYAALALLQRAGEISGLCTQVKFPLHAPSGDLIGTYIADYTYAENGEHVVEDFKGFETDLFRWKRKHLEFEYDLKLRVTRAKKVK